MKDERKTNAMCRVMLAVRRVFDRADRANRNAEATLSQSAEDYAKELNAQRSRHVVSVNWKGDSKRPTIRYSGDDLRDVDNEQHGASLTARWKDCKRIECGNWEESAGCVDRQWAGDCPTDQGRCD